MSTIIPAWLEHVPFIAKQLSDEYVKLNQGIGLDIYKTDITFFSQIVESRIRTADSEFKYFVLVDESWNSIGFISLLQKVRGEILMIGQTSTDKSNLEILLSFWIKFLKENWSTSIVFEASPEEKDYQELLNKIWAKQFSSKYILG